MREHGTREKYLREACRCFACRVASANWRTERNAERRARCPWHVHYNGRHGLWYLRNALTGETEPAESQQEAYERCPALNFFWRLAEEVEPVWASPALLREVRAHLAALAESGLGAERISELSGVARRRVREITAGIGRRERLKYETAQRLLGAPALPASYALVDSRETNRLLGEFCRARISKARVAELAGLNVMTLYRLGGAVRETTAAAVRAAHDQVYRSEARLRGVCRCVEWR